ncbi:hypothetical protein B7Y94_02460 [Candidatus Saccharibacteria bacterium 32-49-12]|nr:MAG: hypothetical protein B7Y94_02460 [Candidatus Saccharibacteria bacterium 32-49-12]
MGDKLTLKLEARELHGKKNRVLRKSGIVPAIVYGPATEPISVQAPYNEIERIWRLAGKHTPVHLNIGSKKKIALIKDVDVEPAKGRLRHVSFHAVKASDPVVAEVPIRLVGEGESQAERAGLVVLQSLDIIEVRALPMDLPEALEVSIVDLVEAGEKLTLADIKLPEGVEFVDHATGHGEVEEDAPKLTDLVIASVYEPSALQAANEAAGGDAEEASADEVESDNGGDTDQDSQAEETRPGGKD